MKTLILIFTLFSFNVFAATGIPSGGGTAVISNTITVAGVVINKSDPNVIIAGSVHNNALSYNTVTVMQSSGTAIFGQVPASKKWTLLAAQAWNNEGTDNALIFGWGTGTEIDTNDPVSVPEYFCGGWTGAATAAPFRIPANVQGPTDFTCPLVIPANGYPFTRHQGTGSGLSITLYFLEEDA